MSFSPSSPVTGAAVTGLTSPTYTLTADTSAVQNQKSYLVTAVGGTQTGVTTHSVGSPFSVAMWRPVSLQIAAFFSTMTGFRAKNPINRYRFVVMKGVTPAVGAPAQMMKFSGEIDIPAGAETVDLVNVKAALSLLGGTLFATGSGIADTIATGAL